MYVAELWFTSLDGTQRLPAYQIGPYGAWGDLTYTFRWGDGACGMFEAQWSMPLPPDFEHPLLRRGTLVEVTDGPWQMGSQLVLAEPGVGTGFDDPWTLTATGVGREVEGESAWYCDDGTGQTTTDLQVAVDSAIANGLPWAGYDSSVPSGAFGNTEYANDLRTVGALFTDYGNIVGKRWGVGRDGVVGFVSDPTTPTYQITPGAVALGTADDNYATVVKVRYLDAATSTLKTAFAPASPSAVEQRFGRREFPVDATKLGAINTSDAQNLADGILAKSKGRLAWTNSLTVTRNEILTMGGVPADLSKVAEDVGSGCMVRLHGIWSDLLETTGATYLDVIIGEAPYADGSSTLELKPLGLAPRDLAAVVESITGLAAA
jgi:hypothetical protein